MAGKVKAGEAYVSLFTDPKALYAGLKAATKAVEDFVKTTGDKIAKIGKGVRSLGLSGLAPAMGLLGAGVKSALDFSAEGNNLDKMAARLNTTSTFLSEMGYAAKMSGADIGAVESAVSSLRSKAMSGDDALLNLGLDPRKLNLMPVEKQFDAVVKQLGLIQSESIRAKMAVNVFGGAGTALIPMLKQGTAGIAAMRNEARALGITMSGEDAKAAVAMTESWTRLTATLNAAKNMIGAALAPVLTDMMNSLSPLIADVGSWIRENRALIVTIGKIAAIVAAVSGGMILAGTAIVGLSAVLSSLGTIIGIVTTGFSLAAGVVAFLFHPITLLIGGVVGLASYFLKSAGVIDGAISWLVGSFKDLYRFGSETFQGIADAIIAGDLGLAMEVAWSAIKLVWVKGANWLMDKWYAVKYGLLEVWSSIGYGIATAWQNTVAMIGKAWTNVVSIMKTVWTAYSNWWQKQMNWMIGKAMGADDAYIESMNRADDARFEQDANAIEVERTTKINAIETERQATTDAMKAAQRQEQAERATLHAGQLTDMQKAEEASQAAWREATGKAAAKRQEFMNKQREGQQEQAKLFGDVNLSMGSTGSAGGTFSAFEVGSLGNDVQRDQLKELTRIREGIEDMTDGQAVVGV